MLIAVSTTSDYSKVLMLLMPAFYLDLASKLGEIAAGCATTRKLKTAKRTFIWELHSVFFVWL